MQPHAIQAVALAYDRVQDRILAVINPAALNSWSYWFTRRVVLELLGRLPLALASSSSIARQAPVEYREDLAAFEREAALATTAPTMTKTPESVLNVKASVAELTVTIALQDQGQTFRLLIRGERGNESIGAMTRSELQRILDMLQREAVKAGWIAGPGMPALDDRSTGPTPARRVVN